jgi:predicted nucleic acid-binding Zn ribbon protein
MSSRKYTDQTLKSVIGELLKSNGLEKKFNELEIIRCYHETVGEYISKKTREAYVKDRTLVVKLDSGPVKEELAYQKTKLIGLINERLGSPFLEQMNIW